MKMFFIISLCILYSILQSQNLDGYKLVYEIGINNSYISTVREIFINEKDSLLAFYYLENCSFTFHIEDMAKWKRLDIKLNQSDLKRLKRNGECVNAIYYFDHNIIVFGTSENDYIFSISEQKLKKIKVLYACNYVSLGYNPLINITSTNDLNFIQTNNLLSFYYNRKYSIKSTPKYSIYYKYNNILIEFVYKHLYSDEYINDSIKFYLYELELDIAQKSLRDKKFDTYLSKYPDGKYKKIIITEWIEYANNISELSKIAKNYPDFSLKADKKAYEMVINGGIFDLDLYIYYFPNGNYINEVKTKKQNILDDIERNYYAKAISGTISDCDTYLSKYPNGKFYLEVVNRKQKLLDEIEYKKYKLALYGNFEDCYAYLSEYPSGKYVNEVNDRIEFLNAKKINTIKSYNDYIKKYPTGMYLTEANNAINAIKNAEEIERMKREREKKIKENSNIAKWQLGYKICQENYNGIIMGSIEQWNADKSRVQIKIAASPGGLTKEGEKLTKGNTIWINPKEGWHICLEDEIKRAVENDKSNEYEIFHQQIVSHSKDTKKPPFDLGTIVYYSFDVFWGLFKYTIKAVVEQWNNEYTKMKIKIIDTDGWDGTIEGQSIYKGATIWVSPFGWYE